MCCCITFACRLRVSCALKETIAWLQAAKGSRSKLFLLDEVDAALDESNQAVVASLMRQLCSQQSGCQCLAVTHSAAFQANCDALVQVSRGDKGTTFSAASSGMGVGKDRKKPRL